MVDTKPIIQTFNPISPLTPQKYERYLPTAYDDSLTMLEKVDKVLDSQNVVVNTVNDALTQMNDVETWVLGDGLQQDVITKLDAMKDDGSLENLINKEILGDVSTLTTNDKSSIVAAVNEVDAQLAEMAQIPDNLVLDGVTDNTPAIQTAIDNSTAPSFILIPPNTNYTFSSLVLKDNITLLDHSDGRFNKVILRGLGENQTVYENEFQILANYNPSLVLENIGSEVGKRLGIVFRRNGKGTWQIADDPLNDGTVQFFIQQLTDQTGATVDKTRISVDQSGKVGIGTRGANSTLHVSSSDGSQATFENTTNTLLLTLKALGDDAKRKHISLGADNTLKINKADNSTAIFSVDDDGNVILYGSTTFKGQMKGYKSNNFSTISSGATPTVTDMGAVIMNYSGATTITNLVTSNPYQEITLVFLNGNVTLQNGASFKLNGGINWTPTPYSSITMLKVDSQTGAWIEKCRSQN